MLSRELEQSLNVAIQKARDARHEYITVEHLLYALLDNSRPFVQFKPVVATLKRCGKSSKGSCRSMFRCCPKTVRQIPSPASVFRG
ncbi:MAG: hypothetical protein Ct9H300mP16_08510 [Pseudomonadota bacterium]|nr:MAG: hypothetical protein Ct9H300mP16_08510 [Pseudomonadota bacterium]